MSREYQSQIDFEIIKAFGAWQYLMILKSQLEKAESHLAQAQMEVEEIQVSIEQFLAKISSIAENSAELQLIVLANQDYYMQMCQKLERHELFCTIREALCNQRYSQYLYFKQNL